MINFPSLPSGEIPLWNGQSFQNNATVLFYSTNQTGWDDELTALHEVEAGDGQHPIDILSRRNTLNALLSHGFPSNGTLLEIGCSSGFLLQDLKAALPAADIIGMDVVAVPLMALGKKLPNTPLLQMDILQCTLAPQQFDAIIALNVLEHIENDEAALSQIARLLKPGGLLILEVPQGPRLYDYFDAYLRHARRYNKKDLLAKCQDAGFQTTQFSYLGILPYPAFFILKKISRLRYGIRGEKCVNKEQKVRGQLKKTHNNSFLKAAFLVDRGLAKMKFLKGIRCFVVARALSNERSK